MSLIRAQNKLKAKINSCLLHLKLDEVFNIGHFSTMCICGASENELLGNYVKVVDNHLATREINHQQGKSIVADAIYNLLNNFRDTVINGNDNIPPLDPLNIPQIGPFEHSSNGVRFNANIHDFKSEGLRWYLIDYVNFNALRLALSIKTTIPWIIVTGGYDASARIGLLSHKAGGKFRVFVNRLEVSVDLRLGTNILGGGGLILRNLDIQIVIHDIQIQISGMVGSSTLNSLINSLVQNAAQNLLRDELDALSQVLSRELFDVISEFLGNFTLDDLLG